MCDSGLLRFARNDELIAPRRIGIDAENRLSNGFVMSVAALQLLGDGMHVAEAALELS